MYEIFARLLKEQGVKTSDVAKATGIASSMFSDWKKGRYHPKHDKMLLIASYFGVSVEYLEGITEERNPRKPQWQNADELEAEMDDRPDSVWIPVLGRIAAGFPNVINEETLGFEPIDYNLAESGRFFALRIAGDSMEPEIKKGAIAVVRCQQDVDNGDVCIVAIDGDEATCKRMQKTDNGIMLVSTNPMYSPMYFSSKDCKEKPITIIGRVMEVRTKF